MQGVADQEHAAAVPGQRHEDRVQRPAVDPRELAQLRVADPADHALECRELVAQPLHPFLARRAAGVEAVLDHEQVCLDR